MRVLDFDLEISKVQPAEPEAQTEFEEPALEITFVAKRRGRMASVKLHIVKQRWEENTKIRFGEKQITTHEQMTYHAATSFALLFLKADMGLQE